MCGPGYVWLHFCESEVECVECADEMVKCGLCLHVGQRDLQLSQSRLAGINVCLK